jgi:hypothetical protein
VPLKETFAPARCVPRIVMLVSGLPRFGENPAIVGFAPPAVGAALAPATARPA